MKERTKTGKLKDGKGASMVIALLYFLICATVGSIILGAASANISHVKAQKAGERNYLAVMSAAELLKEQLKGCSGEWSLEHDLEEAAGEEDRADFKQEMLDEILAQTEETPLKQAILREFYRAYLRYAAGGELAAASGDYEQEVRELKFELAEGEEGEETLPAVKAEFTVTPDYVVMDGDYSQQLHVMAEARFFLADEEEGQYLLTMTAGGLVYYELDEEEIRSEASGTEGEEAGEEEEEVRYLYTSGVVFSPEMPVMSGARRTGGGS